MDLSAVVLMLAGALLVVLGAFMWSTAAGFGFTGGLLLTAGYLLLPDDEDED